MSDPRIQPPHAPSVTADFTLTFEEFAEAYKLQRRRKRFLSGAPERSPWLGCGVIAGVFVLLVITAAITLFVTGEQTTNAAGAATIESHSRVFTFLVGLMPWTFIAGLIWLVAARSVVERRIISSLIALVIVVGAAMALAGALAMDPTKPQAETGNTWISTLPLLVGLIGGVFLMMNVYRRAIRVAWDGQPQLRQPYHVEADEHRLLVQTPLARMEYQWPAVVSFSESDSVFLISYSALTFHVMPKRGFAPGGADAMRSLLQRRAVTADAAPAGFPVIPQPVISLSADGSDARGHAGS